jgi:pimeloyl-ACP methyl ester carboxylesterase
MIPSLLFRLNHAICLAERRRKHSTLAYFLLCAAVLAALAGWVSSPAPAAEVTSREDMICGADLPRPDRDVGLHEQIAHTANGTVGYYRFGHGSPIVLITGYRASMAEWNAYFLGELAKTHDVIIFDNRGIGQSKANGKDYRVEDLARDTAALIRTLNLNKPTVVGWSMGGIVAQQLALDEPALVGRLVLMSSMPAGSRAAPPPPRVERILSGEGKGHFENVMEVLFPRSIDQQAKQCFIGDMFAPRDYAAPKIPEAVTQAQDEILRRWKQDENAFDRSQRISVPTLVLTGTDDKVLLPRNSLVLSQSLPHATLVEVEAGGHAMMYQYPGQLARRIDEFIGH